MQAAILQSLRTSHGGRRGGRAGQVMGDFAGYFSQRIHPRYLPKSCPLANIFLLRPQSTAHVSGDDSFFIGGIHWVRTAAECGFRYLGPSSRALRLSPMPKDLPITRFRHGISRPSTTSLRTGKRYERRRAKSRRRSIEGMRSSLRCLTGN